MSAQSHYAAAVSVLVISRGNALRSIVSCWFVAVSGSDFRRCAKFPCVSACRLVASWLRRGSGSLLVMRADGAAMGRSRGTSSGDPVEGDREQANEVD